MIQNGAIGCWRSGVLHADPAHYSITPLLHYSSSPLAIIKMRGARPAVIVHKTIDLVAHAAEILVVGAGAAREFHIGLVQHVGQHRSPVQGMSLHIGADKILRRGTYEN